MTFRKPAVLPKVSVLLKIGRCAEFKERRLCLYNFRFLLYLTRYVPVLYYIEIWREIIIRTYCYCIPVFVLDIIRQI
jgi:hypothetical protein